MYPKCARCVDRAITEDKPAGAKIRDAVTITPSVMPSPLGVPVVIQIPICYECRRDEIQQTPAGGLIQAQAPLQGALSG